jgi:hypothetical protein
MASLGIPLVVDAYDPGLLETLEQRRGEPFNAQRTWVADASRHLTDALAAADVVLVANDRQRHLIMGMLAASGRLGSRLSAEDPALESFIRCVPFGLPSAPPAVDGRPLRAPFGQLADGAFIAYWGGGLYAWLDPITLIEAVAQCPDPRVSAALLAGPHPTPVVGELPLADVARRRAEELGLVPAGVSFIEHWVPYRERGDWLCDADVGVSLHHRHIETEFSFRTRVLEYLWAGLPVVCTEGDVLARMALVPRTLEARGLDATPVIQAKLRPIQADYAREAVAILERILTDEVGHVAIGNHWFYHLCTERGVEPQDFYREAAQRHRAPGLKPPFNLEARRRAGFTEADIAALPT